MGFLHFFFFWIFIIRYFIQCNFRFLHGGYIQTKLFPSEPEFYVSLTLKICSYNFFCKLLHSKTVINRIYIYFFFILSINNKNKGNDITRYALKSSTIDIIIQERKKESTISKTGSGYCCCCFLIYIPSSYPKSL